MSEKESIQTAGTTSQEGADAALSGAASGTPVEAGRDAEALSPEQELEKLRAERNLYLQSKSKVERANELEVEVTELRRQRDEAASRPQPTYGVVDPRVAQQQQAMQDLQASIQEAQWEAQNGDRKASLLLSLLNRQYQTEQYTLQQLQLQQVPLDERTAVEKKFSTGKFQDVQAAHEAVLGEKWKSESARMQKREKEIEETLTARRNGVLGAGAPIPVTAKEIDAVAAGKMTPQEFAQEHARVFNTQGAEAARAFAKRSLPGGDLTVV